MVDSTTYRYDFLVSIFEVGFLFLFAPWIEEPSLAMLYAFLEIAIQTRPIWILNSASPIFSILYEVSFIGLVILVESTFSFLLVSTPLANVDFLSFAIIELPVSLALFILEPAYIV